MATPGLAGRALARRPLRVISASPSVLPIAQGGRRSGLNERSGRPAQRPGTSVRLGYKYRSLQGRAVGRGGGVSAAAALGAVLGISVLFYASAGAATPETTAFNTSPPSRAVAGGAYQVSATSSSGLPVLLTATGSCSFTKPQAGSEKSLKEVATHSTPGPRSQPSPLTVYFVAPGRCGITAHADCNPAEHECPKELVQEIPVAKDPSERITFTSTAPNHAAVDRLSPHDRGPTAPSNRRCPHPLLARARGGRRRPHEPQTLARARSCHAARLPPPSTTHHLVIRQGERPDPRGRQGLRRGEQRKLVLTPLRGRSSSRRAPLMRAAAVSAGGPVHRSCRCLLSVARRSGSSAG